MARVAGLVSLIVILAAAGCGSSSKSAQAGGGTGSTTTSSSPVAPTSTTAAKPKPTTVTVPPTVAFCTEGKQALLSFGLLGAAAIQSSQQSLTVAQRSAALRSNLDALTKDIDQLARVASPAAKPAVATLSDAVHHLVTDYMIPTGYFSTGAIPIDQQSAYFGVQAQIALSLKSALTAGACG